MSRIRTVKPEFFRHEELFEAERKTGLPLRLAFAGLWTVADREGRFRWRPRVMKLDIMPFDDVDFSAVLDALADGGFVVKYEAKNEELGHIPSWNKHQHINQRESASDLPEPPVASARTCGNIPAHGEGKGREGEREGEGDGADAPPPPEVKSDKRGTRIAPDWALSAEGRAYALAKGIPESKLSEEVEAFRDYWIAKPGKDGLKLDWDAAWRTWAKRSCDFKKYSPPSPLAEGGAPVWVPNHDDRFPPLRERWKATKGKPPPEMGASGNPGVGWFFPAYWVSELVPLKRGEAA